MKAVILSATAMALCLTPAALAATTAESVVQPEPDLASGEAVVYIRYLTNPPQFRIVVGGPGLPAFQIDGTAVATLPKGGCTAVRVPAGKHTLLQSWRLSAFEKLSSSPLEGVGGPVTWEAGKSYYYEFSSKLSRGDALRWFLLPIGSPAGRTRLEGCKYVRPAVDVIPTAPSTPAAG